MIPSNVVFVGSAILFYRISYLVLGNPKQSYEATLLFIYNPASIHFSSFYSESLYSFLSNFIILQYVRSHARTTSSTSFIDSFSSSFNTPSTNSIILIPLFYLPTLLQAPSLPFSFRYRSLLVSFLFFSTSTTTRSVSVHRIHGFLCSLVMDPLFIRMWNRSIGTLVFWGTILGNM